MLASLPTDDPQAGADAEADHDGGSTCWLVESAVGYDSAGAGASLAGPRQIDAKVAYKIASLRVDQ